jgi:predicted nucleic acid-binding protein
MALELPFVAMIDTTVFLCQMGEKPDEEHAPACIDFCERMVRQGRQLLVAAPTITEVTRKRGAPLPRVSGIVVVAFDEQAASKLGVKMPADALKEWRDATGRKMNHIKYDALIVGCALRVPACTFVSMDDKQRELASRCGLAAHHPREYVLPSAPKKPVPPAQPSLFGRN